MTDARVSQVGLEGWAAADPQARVSQEGLEAWAAADPQVRASLVGLEIWASTRTITPPPRQAQFLAG